MLELKVTVELPGIADAINNLADAMRGGAKPQRKPKAEAKKAPEVEAPAEPVNEPVNEPEPSFIQDIPADEPEIPAVEQPEQAPPLAEVPAPVESGPVIPQAPVTPAPVAEPEPPKKVYTFRQISQAGAALCADLQKLDALVKLLNTKYGVQAITAIDPSRYPELAEDLIGLGAVIKEE